MEPDAVERSWAAWYLKYAPPQPADEFPKSVTVTPQQIDRAARRTTLDAYRAGVAASPSEEVEAALVAADRLAEYVEFQGRSGHNWPTTAEAQRTYITVRRALAALRTTKEGGGGRSDHRET